MSCALEWFYFHIFWSLCGGQVYLSIISIYQNAWFVPVNLFVINVQKFGQTFKFDAAAASLRTNVRTKESVVTSA
jgi:hypothetical protein